MTQMERIRRLHAAEAAAGRKATQPGDIPFNYEAITPEWMTHVMCGNHASARVTEVTLDVPDDGTSNRRRIFLKYNAAGDAAGMPPSVFCKATTAVLNRINMALSGGIQSETAFYHKIRPLLDLDVPTAYLATYDPESFGSIIVLEDIAGEVEFCGHATPIDFSRVTSQLDLLAKLHGQFQQNEQYTARSLDMFTWPDFFDRVVSYGHEGASNNGFVAAEEVIPPRLFKRLPEVWPAINFVNQTHRELPATLIHGDCHLKQWFIRNATGTMGLTDWQCATFGNWARDVAYMVTTSLAIEDRRRWEQELLKHYLEALAATGAVVPDFNEAWLRYRQNIVQAMSWWTGTLTPTEDQPDMQPRETSLAFIERFAHAIDDLDALDACKP